MGGGLTHVTDQVYSWHMLLSVSTTSTLITIRDDPSLCSVNFQNPLSPAIRNVNAQQE